MLNIQQSNAKLLKQAQEERDKMFAEARQEYDEMLKKLRPRLMRKLNVSLKMLR